MRGAARLLLAAAACLGLGSVQAASPAPTSAPTAPTPEVGITQRVADVVGEQECGVESVQGDDRAIDEKYIKEITTDLCEKKMRTNCNMTFFPIKCPEECPFIAPSRNLPCYFACTAAASCSAHNPDLPFPDDRGAQKLCSKCSVSLCKQCDSPTTCADCHKGFKIGEDTGSTKCVVDHDETWLHIILFMVFGLLLTLVVLACVWPCCHGNHNRAPQHLLALRLARRFRHLSKPARWNLDSKKAIRTWYTLGENMHKTNIAGVGIALWYNTLIFLMSVSLMGWGFMYIAQQRFMREEGIGFIETHQLGKVDFDIDVEKVPDRSPLLLASPLSHCDTWQYEESNDYAARMFVAVATLYMVLFCFSVWFAKYQKKYAQWWDETHPQMADYAIRVSGFPVDETDEGDLKAKLEKVFRLAYPDKLPRPERIKYSAKFDEDDDIEQVPDGYISVHAVSIAYEFSEPGQRQKVDDALWKMMETLDVELYEKAKEVTRNEKLFRELYQEDQLSMASTSLVDPGTPNITVSEAHAKIEKMVDELFTGESKLKGSGTAYVVFDYIEDRERIQNFADKNELKLPDGTKLSVTPIFTEPPGIVWWSQGDAAQNVKMNMARTIRKIFLLIFVLEAGVALPYYYYIQKPFQDVGSRESGLIVQVYGAIISNINGLIFAGIYSQGESIGFYTKDDLFGFVAATTMGFVVIITVVNTILLNLSMINGQSAGDHIGLSIGFSNLIITMMPNLFLVGKFMNVIIPTIQFAWNQFLAKIIFVWKCLPDGVLRVLVKILPYNPGSIDHWPFRNAEKLASPWEIPVMGDYSDFVTQPALCFFMLGFVSTKTYQVFMWMFIWSGFLYMYGRYTHLRFHGMNYYTNGDLQSVGMYLWGLALSVLAAQIPHWWFGGIDVGEGKQAVKWVLMVATFAASYALWFSSIHYYVRPFQVEDVKEQNVNLSVAEVKMWHVYDWLNTNPVYALKSRYYFQTPDGTLRKERSKNHPLACGENPDVVRYYEVGKEYLFVQAQRQYLLGIKVSNILEPDHWVDMAAGMMGTLASLVPEGIKPKPAKFLSSTIQALAEARDDLKARADEVVKPLVE